MKVYKKSKIIFQNAKFSSNFGLMFKPKLKNNETIILKLDKESKINSIIHMLFVFYPIYVIWLNKEKIIVGIKKCYPFQLFAIPKNQAMYVIECSKLPNIKINDKLEF